MQLPRLTPSRAVLASGFYVAVWGTLFGVLLAARGGSFGDLSERTVLGMNPVRALTWVVDPGGWIGLYLIGLVWVVYLVEWAARRIERRKQPDDPFSRPVVSIGDEHLDRRRSRWNPFDPAARYFGFAPSFVCFLLLATIAVAGFVPASLDVGPDLAKVMEQVQKVCEALRPLWAPALLLSMIALGTAVAQSKRVRQSLSMLTAYSLLFFLAYFLAHQSANAGDEIESELPAGGGNDSIKATQVKVKKVVRKKYVINPYSSILFAAPPPIDQIEMKFDVETAHQHKAGSGPGGLGKGDGKGGGFGSGTAMGKYELVRLQHSDKNWNKNFGIGGDRNLLLELKSAEPLTKISEEDRSVDYATLARASTKKPFPLVYVGGTNTFTPSENERKILRDYLIDKHGMILGDNLGGHNFHYNFVNEMTRITGVQPVVIPRDDRIHQRPYELPQLPLVVLHAPRAEPLGWKIDGRWAVYYHPGALSDAWRDDHAGIKKAVWQQCYQLGINILYYAYAEQHSWREANQSK